MNNETVREWMIGPDGLSTGLRGLRTDAGLSGREIAEVLGWPNYRVSKIENGRQMPSRGDIEAWAAACNANAEALERLLEDLDRATSLHLEWRGRAGTARASIAYRDLVASSTDLRFVEVDLVPGILQTPDYCLAIQEALAVEVGSTASDTADKVRVRMEMARAVYEPGKRIRAIIGEAALHYWYAPGPVMRAQLAHLGAVAGLSNVEIAVTPFGVQLPAVMYHSFAIYDDLVIVETRSTESIYQPTEERAKLYDEVWPRLWAQSLTGDEARARIQAIAGRIDPEAL